MIHKRLDRYHLQGAIYFVTTKTKGNYPYFLNKEWANFCCQQIEMTAQIQKTVLYVYVVMPDHVHILVQAEGSRTISDYMHYFKRHFSRNIRILASRSVAEDGHLPLRE